MPGRVMQKLSRARGWLLDLSAMDLSGKPRIRPGGAFVLPCGVGEGRSTTR